MEKGLVLSPALREQTRRQARFQWAAAIALTLLYAAAMPLFLMAGLCLLPIVSVARFVDRVNCTGRKECHEKDTQSEQAPPTCHENILFDLAEAECTHMCVERCRSTRVLANGFDVRSNEVYEPVCSECGCPRRRSRSPPASPAAAPVSVRPASSKSDRVSTCPVTPVFATPSPRPAPRPRVSPSPSSVPLLFLVTPQQQHNQPPNTPPEQPDHRPATACLGLLSPDGCQRPEALLSPLSTSISTTKSASTPLLNSSFETDSAKMALLLMGNSSNTHKARKDQVSSAPSSRRPSFGNPQPRQRAAPRTSSGHGAACTSASGASSLSGSRSVSSEPETTAAGVVGSDLGKPSYMRGTATSKARLNSARTHELSRLGCSVQLQLLNSTSVSRRALTAASFRLSAQY